MKNFILVISSIILLQLLTLSYCKAQKIELIKDICTSTSNSNPHNITIVGNTTYFFATGDEGYGLWKKNNSSVEFIKKLSYQSKESINHKGILFFTTANEKDYSKSTIWSSDGTEEGTKIINKNTLENVQSLTSFNKRLCYVQRKNNVKSLIFYDRQKTDTIKNVKISFLNKNLKVYNNSIYYFERKKLFKVDNSFKTVKEIKLLDGFEPSYLLDTLNNKLYLIGGNNSNSYKIELVSIDAQDNSKKIRVIQDKYTFDNKYKAIRYGNEIYFNVIKNEENYNSFELWKTDGTSNNTKTIKTINYPDYTSDAPHLTVFNDKLYFIVETSQEISNIWQYERSNNTVKLLDSNPFSNPSTLATDGKTLYFSAYDTSYGQELWESDGVTKHKVIKDLNTSNCSSNIRNITKFKEKLYFSAFTPTHGQEFWSSDGTKEGTSILKDINSGKVSSYPDRMAILDDNLYFNARTEQYGTELWKSDGTEKGTKLFKDFITGPKSSSPSRRAKYKNRLFFFAKASSQNSKVDEGFWSTDGTIEGTKIVKPNISSPFSYSSSYIIFKDNLFFTAYESSNSNGSEIWITDGTPSNTKEFKDIFKKGYFSSSYPNYYASLNDKFYFQARDTLGTELWVSDGTNEGTKLLKDIIEGKEGSDPRFLTTYNNKILFSAKGENKGRELWITDGTKEGTKLLKDINSGKKSSNPYEFTVFENKLFFSATTEEYGRELWVTDGTESGTKLYMDINKGRKSSFPYALTPFKSKLYLRANNGENGSELMAITPKESDNTTTLSVLDDTKTTPIILYPNPAQSFFILKSAVEGKVNILDLSGKVLINGKINSEINIDHLPLGLYPVEVILINGKTYKTKLLKKD